jgi:anti-sigma-K factor RskA
VEAQEIISSGLLELYAAGLTSKEESLQVEAWINEFPEVAEELVEIQSTIETYAIANAIQPDPSVKEKLLAQINKEGNTKAIPIQKATAKVVKMPSSWKWVAAASVLLLMGNIALNVSIYNKYDTASKDLQQIQQQLANATQTDSSMKQDMSLMKEDMSVVQSKYSEPVALHGMGVAPDAAAKIFWMKNTGDVYVDPSNLPDVEPGKQFQLWAIVDGKPMDAGMIITFTKGEKYHIQKMKSFGKAEAFAITIEKEGGSPTPTMDKMVVMGKL